MTWAEEYQTWGSSVFGAKIPIYVSETIGATSVSPLSKKKHHWYKVWEALLAVEYDIVNELLLQIRDENVSGAIAEFGIFEGTSINRLYEACAAVGLDRDIWGFDSFQGLSKPHSQFDASFWQEGSYACSLEKVRVNVKADERPNIKFVEGFFEHSLVSKDATDVKQISFARIDCDIYEPTVDCLRYLAHRLSHGSVLAFDDWTYYINSGETKAFAEWISTVPHLEFEYLFSGAWGHFYIRVWHKGRDRYDFEI